MEIGEGWKRPAGQQKWVIQKCWKESRKSDVSSVSLGSENTDDLAVFSDMLCHCEWYLTEEWLLNEVDEEKDDIVNQNLVEILI